MAFLTHRLAPAAAVSLVAASLAACSESGPRIYTAQLYRADPGCLDAYSALGLVQSTELRATCAPVCLRLDGALYVSPVCSPYPARVTLEASGSGDCAAALLALSAGAACARAPADAAATTFDASPDVAPDGP